MKRIPILMPHMGQSIAEGNVLRWHKQVGDEVELDELLVDVESDKISFEVESPAAGILVECLTKEGDSAKVGKPIGALEVEGDEDHAAPGKETPVTLESDAFSAVPAEDHSIDVGDLPDITRDWLSPSVARLAIMNNITGTELAQVQGTGHGGRITRNNLLEYMASRPEVPQHYPASGWNPENPESMGKVVPMTALRRTIADHMVQSIHTSAHVTMVHAVDTTHIVELRNQIKDDFYAAHGVKLTYTAVMLFATARLLREFPYINASVMGSSILLRDAVNIGCAVALEDQSLVVPVVRDADQKPFIEIAKDLDRLIALARNQELSRTDIEDGTFTISNFGTFGSLFGTPIINQPQVAILGMGAIKKTLVPKDDSFETRDVINLSLSFDHRVIDGAMGGRFLNRLQESVEALSSEALGIAQL